MSKQKNAFLNITNKHKVRHLWNNDRDICAKNFKNYLYRCSTGKATIKGDHVSIYDFVKDAVDILNNDDDDNDENVSHVRNVINLQWEANAKQTINLDKIIAMVDTSASMCCDSNGPLYNAMGLGIRIAEKSAIGNRVMTFSSTPEWVNLDDCPDFVSKIKKVRNAPWGMNTNFYAAFDKILDAYVNMDIDPDNTEDVVLAILSDMQIDAACSEMNHINDFDALQPMIDVMNIRFTRAGMQSKYKKPYKLPFIVFWNLKKTDGFPATSLSKNTMMISGFSPLMLNQFMERGVEALHDCTPWSSFIKSIDHPRYKQFETAMQSYKYYML
jgi:hypothetical protein